MPHILETPPDLFSGVGIVLSGFTSTAPNVKCETKKDAIVRAKRLYILQKEIDEAPDAIEMSHCNILSVEHFIKCSIKGVFDCNCHDGLMRLGHSFEEMADVPAQEYDAWFHNEPPYKDRLHPVTIVALNQSKAIMREDIVRVKSRLPQWQAEVEQLKARGPLPQDVAENCKLTVDGDLAVRTGFGSVDSTPEELPTTGSEFTVTVRVAALEPELPEAGEQTSFLPLFCSSMF